MSLDAVPAIRTAFRELGEIGVEIEPTDIEIVLVCHGRVMVHPTAIQFGCKRIVSRLYTAGMELAFGAMSTGDCLPVGVLLDRSDHLMQFRVFAEKVLITKQSRIDPPHSRHWLVYVRGQH